MAQTQLSPGSRAPGFTLEDSQSHQVRLGDFRGKNVIVYFYPAAGTTGCTTEACDFRDNLNSLKAAGYSVIGISPDEPERLARFAEEQGLNFPLLSDPDHSVALSWGAWGPKEFQGQKSIGLIRSTFVLDDDANVVLAHYGVTATGHVAALRSELELD
jgi:peroxiredoxin Q/BCP